MNIVLSTLFRYLRLYKAFLVFSLSKGLEFRFDFYMRIIMDLVYYAVAIAFFKVLYIHTNTLGGWNESQIMLFVSGYLLIDAIMMTFFSNNLWWLPVLINKGDLDYYLVRPVSSLFFLSLREFALNSFFNLLFATGIFIWALLGLEQMPSMGAILLYIGLLCNGAFIVYCMHIIINTLVFWTHAPQGFGELIWNMTKFSEQPDKIYKGWFQKLLVTVLPFSVMTSYPARILLDGFNWKIFLHCIGLSAVFFTVMVLFWRQGLKNYSSASS